MQSQLLGHTGHSSHTEIRPVHQRDAVCKTCHGDQPPVNAVDDLALLFVRVFLVIVDVVEGALADILDILHAARFLAGRR